MKLTFLLFLIILVLKCDLPNDSVPEYDIIEKYPLCLIDSDGRNYQVLRDDGYAGALLHFLDDDKIFIMWTNSIYHYNIKTSELKFIKHLPTSEIMYRTISPNGQYLAFVGYEKGQTDLYVVNLYGNNLKNLTNSPSTIERWPSFSLDGSKIIFTTSSDYDDQTISFYDFKTDTVLKILSHFDTHTKINPIIYYYYPCFGENDSQIYFIKRNTDTKAIGDTLFQYDMNTNTYNIIDTGVIGKLIISDFKNRLVYFKSGNPCAVTIVDPDGNNKRILDNEVSYDCEYTISKDGKKIIYWDPYYYGDHRDYPLFIINHDGSNKKKLASGSNAYFSDDSKRIVFTGYVRNH